MKRLALFVGFLAFTGCGSSSTTTDGGATGTGGTSATGGAGGTSATGGTTGTGGAIGTGGAGGTAACVTVQHDGPEAPEVSGQGDFPAPAGGAVTPGKYDLKEFRIYPPGSVDDYKRHETILISADGKFEDASISTADNVEKKTAGTYTAAGSELTLNLACPTVASGKVSYTTSGNELWFFDLKEKEVHVYTRRP
jgi:hypothetical protein